MSDRALIEQLDRAIDGILSGPSGPSRTVPPSAGEPTLSGLIKVAGMLRDMPDDRFKMRLSHELQADFERRTSMTATQPAKPIDATLPEFAAIHTITPFISVPDGAGLIEFMKNTFNAEETNRHPHGPDGFVAGMRIADSDLLIMSGESLRGQESPGALHVYVPDCDATYRRALNSGAFPIGGPGVGEPGDRPYGERAAFVADSFGNYWFIATRSGPDYVGLGLGHVTPCLLTSNAAPIIDFVKRAFGARVQDLYEESGRLAHAFVHIGGAVIEMAEEEAETGKERRQPFAFYMHTDDVDAVYDRAIAAGATSFLPPGDQPFGDRLAIFADSAGNRWFAAKRIVRGEPA